MTYEIHDDSLAIWQGDIVLGLARDIPATREEAETKRPAVSFGVAIDGTGYRWPNGIVPYEIDPALPDPSRVTAAIAQIERKSAVWLVPRAGVTVPAYVRFVPHPSSCNSWVGRQATMQIINITDRCSAGSVAHEINHALGMFHEQSRCDRDQYVQVLYANIIPSMAYNYDKICDVATDYGVYDERSIMHYPPVNSFSINGLPTLRSLRGRDALMGQRDSLVAADSATLAALYPELGLCKPVRPDKGCLERPLDDRLSVVGPAGPYQGIEGGSVAVSAGDAQDGLTYSWDFGEADSTAARGTGAQSSHAYSDNGTYQVALTVISTTGEVKYDVTTATIDNVAPVASAGSDRRITSGTTLKLSGSFTDAGLRDRPWIWEVRWGNGSMTTAQTPVQGPQSFYQSRYLRAGTYNLTLKVTDKDGGVGVDTVAVTVTRIVRQIDVIPGNGTLPNTISLTQPSQRQLEVAILTKDGFDARRVQAATVTLGNGVGAEASALKDAAGVVIRAVKDTDGDGDLDVVLKFSRAALVNRGDLTTATTRLVLRADLVDGRQLEGRDAVQVVP